jgi:hypothetical protein
MASLYKDHTIVNTGRLVGSVDDPAGFLPMAIVTWYWPDQSRRVMQVLKSRQLYHTPEEASAAALQKAKLWVDGHL